MMKTAMIKILKPSRGHGVLGRRGNRVLNSVVREGLTEKVTLE